MACLTPFVRQKGIMKNQQFPCGNCPDCRARRISAWSLRLMQQYKISTNGYFITLTYDTKHVPITSNGFLELKKRDVQLFFKRLRKTASKTTGFSVSGIRYYACGEYGGKTRRPHYHAIIFNVAPELIEASWGLGTVHYGQISEASVGYTLKYISKGRTVPMHRNDDRQPEFSLMSKGLGKSYLTPQMVQWHKADLENRMYCNLPDGKKVSMPRYYKDKLYTEDERQIVSAAYKQRIKENDQKAFERSGSDIEKMVRNHQETVLAERRKQHFKINQSKRNEI